MEERGEHTRMFETSGEDMDLQSEILSSSFYLGWGTKGEIVMEWFNSHQVEGEPSPPLNQVLSFYGPLIPFQAIQ